MGLPAGFGIGKNLVGFTSFNQNIVSSIESEPKASTGWWGEMWSGLSDTVSKITSTYQEVQKNQDTTPAYVPEWFPPYWTQSDLPPGGIVSGPGDQPISLHLPPQDKPMNWTPVLIGLGVAVLLFNMKR